MVLTIIVYEEEIQNQKVQETVEDNNDNIGDYSENEKEDNSNTIETSEIGQELLLDTNYGKFYVTIDAVKAVSDDDANEGNKMVLVECTIKNESFEDPYNSSLYLEHYLTVLDEDNFVIESENSGKHEVDGYYFNTEIPKGSNGKEYVGYQIKDGHKTMTIRLNDQYEVVAPIQ